MVITQSRVLASVIPEPNLFHPFNIIHFYNKWREHDNVR
jgi:hypothetical protein